VTDPRPADLVGTHHGAECRYHATAAEGPVLTWTFRDEARAGGLRVTHEAAVLTGQFRLSSRNALEDLEDLLALACHCRRLMQASRTGPAVKGLLQYLEAQDDSKLGKAS
jgi:hypothetical protein